MSEQETFQEIEDCNARSMAIVLDELHAQGVEAEQVGDMVERRSMDHVVGVAGAAGAAGVYIACKVADRAIDLTLDAAIEEVKDRGIVLRRRFTPTGRHAVDRVVGEPDPVQELRRMENEARRTSGGE